jgi:phosphoribosylformylglycinamidine synthase
VIDLAREAALQKLIVGLIRDGLVESAHDCSEGGLAVAIAEGTFDTNGLGVTIDVPAAQVDSPSLAINATLFGESASRIVVSVAARHLNAVMKAAGDAGVPAREIGKAGGDRIRISVDGMLAIDTPVVDAEGAWATAIEKKMARPLGTRNP